MSHVSQASVVKNNVYQTFGFESRQGLWILSCEEAVQLAYGTSVVLLMCPLVPEKKYVFLHQKRWKVTI